MPATTAKQREFLDNFNHYNRDFDVVLNCPENCEGWFSKYSCDTCRDPLAGQRHPVVFFKKGTTRQVSEGACCEDCQMFIANGQLPE